MVIEAKAADRAGGGADEPGVFVVANRPQREGDELRNWLVEVRTAARARAIEVQLARDARGYTGSVVLNLGSGGAP